MVFDSEFIYVLWEKGMLNKHIETKLLGCLQQSQSVSPGEKWKTSDTKNVKFITY